MLLFALGVLVGIAIGVVLMALLVASRGGEDEPPGPPDETRDI